MEKKTEYGYIQFPLCLLKETYHDFKKGMNLITDYGIVCYAKKLHYCDEDVSRQLIYDYTRHKDSLGPYLLSKLSEISDIDDDFANGNILWTEGIEPSSYLIEAVQWLLDNDSRFEAEAVLHYQLHLATSTDHLSITFNEECTLKSYNEALKIKEKFECQFGRDAIVSIKLDMIMNFIDNEADIDLFRAYVGIRSLIGRRNFISCNKPAILSRMLGLKSKEAFNYFIRKKQYRDDNLLPIYEKFKVRYHMDRLIRKLVEKKFIMFLSIKNVSTMYFSKYMAPKDLAGLVQKSKERNLETERREAASILFSGKSKPGKQQVIQQETGHELQQVYTV